jgi:hypothetical protein
MTNDLCAIDFGGFKVNKLRKIKFSFFMNVTGCCVFKRFCKFSKSDF